MIAWACHRGDKRLISVGTIRVRLSSGVTARRGRSRCRVTWDIGPHSEHRKCPLASVQTASHGSAQGPPCGLSRTATPQGPGAEQADLHVNTKRSRMGCLAKAWQVPSSPSSQKISSRTSCLQPRRRTRTFRHVRVHGQAKSGDIPGSICGVVFISRFSAWSSGLVKRESLSRCMLQLVGLLR